MKKIKKTDLDQLEKDGSTVKRQLGIKKPEPEDEAAAALSGEVAVESPAPASLKEIPKGSVETSRDNDHTHTVEVPNVDAAEIGSIVQQAIQAPLEALNMAVAQQAELTKVLQKTIDRQGKQIEQQNEQLMMVAAKPRAKDFSIEFPDGRKAVMKPNYGKTH